MTVNRTQNSVPVQPRTDIADGTTNTMKSAKAENRFAKDVFESSKPTANGLCTNEIIEGTVLSSKDVEKPPAKKSFMDYTDDSCD